MHATVEAGSRLVRVELAREDRVSLAGTRHPELGMSRPGWMAIFRERPLSDADRWVHPARLSRDVIDLAMMTAARGAIAAAA